MKSDQLNALSFQDIKQNKGETKNDTTSKTDANELFKKEAAVKLHIFQGIPICTIITALKKYFTENLLGSRV